MSLHIVNLTMAARRRLLLAYVSRESAWRVLVIMAAVLLAAWLKPLWILPWLALLGVAIHWMIRWRSPTQLAAAIEIDRQFSLKELISSGLSAGDGEGLGAATASEADRVAAGIDAASLNVGRFGVRYWALSLLLLGVALAMPDSPLTGAMSRVSSSEQASGKKDAAGPASVPQIPLAVTSVSQPRRMAGDAEADFGLADEQSGEVGGGQSDAARSRSASGSQSGGGGLATGGSASAAPPAAPLAASAPGENGMGEMAGSGAGQSSMGGGKAPGSGVISRNPAPNSGLVEGESPHVAQGAETPPAARVVPRQYREVVKEFYAR